MENNMIRREDRAKQFMPFDALKGFNEALKKKEEIYNNNKEKNYFKHKTQYDFFMKFK